MTKIIKVKAKNLKVGDIFIRNLLAHKILKLSYSVLWINEEEYVRIETIDDVIFINAENEIELVIDETKGEENKMNENVKKVFEMLGVEPNEEFKIGGSDFRYRINEKLILEYAYIDKPNWAESMYKISDLLTGKEQIIKKLWKPDDGRKYFFVSTSKDIATGCFFNDNTFSFSHYKLGNCYRTKEEITPEIIDKWVKFYGSDEVLDI